MRRLLVYLIALFTVLACAPDLESEFSGEWDPSLEGKPVTFTFSVPDVRIAPTTKGVDGSDGLITGDPYLDPDKLYIVVCGGTQSIKYIRKAEMVLDEHGDPVVEKVPVGQVQDYPLTDGTETVTMYEFTVQLELTDSHRTVYFLGNIDENQLVTGSYAYQILPSLQSYEGKQAYWQRVNMPPVHAKVNSQNNPIMEGGSYLPSEEAAAALKHVPLIRNYAKIQVTDSTAPEDGFELYSYAVIYFPKYGSVAPYRSNVDDIKDAFNFNNRGDSYRFSGYERCSFTELDENLEYLGYLSPNVEFDHVIPTAAMFEDPSISGGRVIRYDKNNPELGFYLYERNIPNDNLEPTFVIIRGKFGDGEFYYYRLDLMETKVVNYQSVYQYYPIYRNFRYSIQLNRISSIGVSTPEAAAQSSGAEDISADISMRHLSDISNGQTRLVVEPFMSKTYTGPNEEGYYYIYARFYNDVNSSEPNVDWGAVSVELEQMEGESEDILILYDDVGNEVQSFYPAAQTMGGEPGFRVIRFNTKAAGSQTKTQKIKITGRNLYTHEEYPLYREVEITLQKKQSMTVTCATPELALQKGVRQTVNVTIPAGLPESMFPLEFTMEAERPTLTPDNEAANNNLPVKSGISISDNEGYEGKQTIQFIRTLTLDEYKSLLVTDGTVTFSSYFKSNTSASATTVWVANDYFIKGYTSFTNVAGYTGQFYVQADYDTIGGCIVVIHQNNLEYNVNEEGWQKYTIDSEIEIPKGQKVYFRSTATINGWGGSSRFYCYSPGSDKTQKDGHFSIGGNIASLIVGDDYPALGSQGLTGDWTFNECFSGHKNLIDASELILPMLTCKTGCYKAMFSGCTSLTAIPELPATTLANSCYERMFEGCTSLAYIPYDYTLPAVSLPASCYKSMFKGCAELVSAPAISATSVGESACEAMFYECAALTTVQGLTVSDVSKKGCYQMFLGCISLTSALGITLSAPTLNEACYYSMFEGCTSLASAPDLPASTLVKNCYNRMFYGCALLNSVRCMATSGINTNGSTSNWLYGVAATGTFTQSVSASWTRNSASGIPVGWTILNGFRPVFPEDPFDAEEDF